MLVRTNWFSVSDRTVQERMTSTSLMTADCSSRLDLRQRMTVGHIAQFSPAQRYASAGLCDSDVSVRPSVCPSGRLSHAGIVPSRPTAGS